MQKLTIILLQHIGVFSVRSIENSRDIRDYISKLDDVNDTNGDNTQKQSQRRKCVIVGAGFIGLEMCENMIHRNFDCTIIDVLDQVMGPIDKEMILPFHRVLKENKVNLMLGEKLSGIFQLQQETQEMKTDGHVNTNANRNQFVVLTESGVKIAADIVILGLGVTPESTLAEECGLSLGVRGSIVTNSQMQTSDPDIFSVGDVVQTKDCILNTDINLALAGPAQQQARVVADFITSYVFTVCCV